jgi:hypothetical protein
MLLVCYNRCLNKLEVLKTSFPIKDYALSGTAIHGSFSIGILAKRFTFYLQPQKVNKKGRSPNYVLHPIIFNI